MKKVFYLKTCSTCRRIMSELDLDGWELRELKSNNVTEEELSEMHHFTKSYEALFSKRSTQIRIQNIEVKKLTEKDFKDLILKHYSFLKRPVFLTEKGILIGRDGVNILEIL
ncbi:arsenate reductase family protein [Riemerella columbipharyngis]|uniref:Arsenate reductase, glutaredoxin family n=1 Tax=Riemerella columbipharyngis TaxID=1071918 RepID=A0A1G6ZK13_9FLAO|nr:ArsC/Spx/MgsR family protein [Riemerella columbipharyngis]SDE02841.1 Arsenate reductase, glutaredoxin family [Riemerella columbipharyngis]